MGKEIHIAGCNTTACFVQSSQNVQVETPDTTLPCNAQEESNVPMRLRELHQFSCCNIEMSPVWQALYSDPPQVAEWPHSYWNDFGDSDTL